MNIIKEIDKFFDAAHAFTPSRYIRKFSTMHNNPDSLQFVSDLLNSLSIQNRLEQLNPNTHHLLPAPFFAEIQNDQGETKIQFVKEVEKFDGAHSWTGAALLTTYPSATTLPEYDNYRQWATITIAFTVFLTAAFGLCYRLATPSQGYMTFFLLTAITGLVIAAMSLIERAQSTSMLPIFIRSGYKKRKCFASSFWAKTTRISNIQRLDFTMAYFAFQTFILLTAAAYDWRIISVIIAVFLSVPFYIERLFHMRKDNSLSNFLLMVTVAAQVLYVVYLPFWKAFFSLSFSDITYTLFTYGLFLVLVLLLKGYIYNNRNMDQNKSKLFGFLTNKRLITSHLFSSPTIPQPLKSKLFFGHQKASIQLQIIYSLFDESCAIAQEMVHSLINFNNCPIGVTVAFTHDTTQEEVDALHYLMSVIAERNDPPESALAGQHIMNILLDWYHRRDLALFKKDYPLVGEITADISNEVVLSSWACRPTPIIFINNHQLSAPYTYSELPYVIPALSQYYAKDQPFPFIN
jgi:hypothetical protein